MKVKKIKINIVFIIAFILLTFYFFSLYYIDQIKVSEFLNEIKNKINVNNLSSEINYDLIIKIRDSVVSELKFRPEHMGKRQIWGYRVSNIIKNRAGECGEATRLLLNVFKNIKIPARRVTFYRNNSMHAVLEVKIKNRWYIIDTKSGPIGFEEFTTNNPLSISDHFQKQVSTKTHLFNVSEEMQKFNITHFTYFFNMNSILYKSLGLHIYVVKPLPNWIYYLLENPPLIAAWISFIMLIAVLILTFLLKRRHTKKNANRKTN